MPHAWKSAVIKLCEPKQVFYEFFQVPCLAIGNLYVLVLHVQRYLGIACQQLQIADDGSKGVLRSWATLPGYVAHSGAPDLCPCPSAPDILHHLYLCWLPCWKTVIANHVNGVQVPGNALDRIRNLTGYSGGMVL